MTLEQTHAAERDAFTRYHAAKAENPNAVILVKRGESYHAYDACARVAFKGWANASNHWTGSYIRSTWDTVTKKTIQQTQGPAAEVDECVRRLQQAGHTVVLC